MSKSAPDHFNAVAGRYAASEVHADSPTIRRLHEILKPKAADSICEVACGPGYLALSFAGKVARIVGVDAAPNMLRQFEKLAGERAVSVESVQAFAEQLPFPSDHFDTVVSRLAAHHFPDVAKAIQEMARVAKPGGCVAVIDLEGNENPELDDLMHQLETLHDASHVRSYTATRWREFFRAGCLSVESLEPGHTELVGGLSIQRWCDIGNTPKSAQLKIRAVLAALPKEQLAALGIHCEDGEYFLPVRTLIIVGRKPGDA